MKFRLVLIIIFLIVLNTQVFSQSPVYNNIFDDSIKTITIKNPTTQIGSPVLYLNSGEVLDVDFDRMGSDVKNYQYTVYHCDKNWEKSNILISDYLDVMGEVDVMDVQPSMNTRFDYVHYHFSFPNQDFKILLSGNYVLRVYEDNNQDDIVFEKRFMVVENIISIMMDVKKASMVEYMDECQEVEFTLNTTGFSVDNPYEDISVLIMQNDRWDNAKSTLKPLYVKSDELLYRLDYDNYFSGGNEFRTINFKSFNYVTEEIKRFSFENPYWHVYLKPDEVRRFKVFKQDKDLNGKFFIATEAILDSRINADYAYVHFELPYDVLETEGDIYVCGALTNWLTTGVNRMVFNSEKMKYELVLLLKQGYYDYQYFFVDNKINKIDNTLIEGNHSETENDYQLFVYYHEKFRDYYRIIGYKKYNTITKE